MIFIRNEVIKKVNMYSHNFLGAPILQIKQEELKQSTDGLIHFVGEALYEQKVEKERLTLDIVEECVNLYLMGKLSDKLEEGKDYALDTLLKMYEEALLLLCIPQNEINFTMSRFAFVFLNCLSTIQNSSCGIIWRIDNVEEPMFLPNHDNPEVVGTLVTRQNHNVIDTINFIIYEIRNLEQEKGRK